jgi:hypothetical protein
MGNEWGAAVRLLKHQTSVPCEPHRTAQAGRHYRRGVCPRILAGLARAHLCPQGDDCVTLARPGISRCDTVTLHAGVDTIEGSVYYGSAGLQCHLPREAVVCPTIRIDDDVYAALQAIAVPFQDTPNSVLRRVLDLPASSESGEAQVPSTSKRSTPRGRRPRSTARERTRAPKGSILPESEYEIPLLQSLIELGGSATASEVVNTLAPKLEDRLTDLDTVPLPSGRVRWHNRAQFTRLNLVRGGDLLGNSPRGVWAISEQGRARIATANGVTES